MIVSLVKPAKGLMNAAMDFIVVGLVFPYLVEFFSREITSYIPLPAPQEVWGVFIAIGAAFAVTSFLQNAYSKGDYPWLAGKLGSAVANIALFTFLYSLVPSSALAGGTVETSGLLYLIYLAIALSYGYLILDFLDARRSAAERVRKAEAPSSPPPSTITMGG